MGDVTDSTLMHINDLPIPETYKGLKTPCEFLPIPIPIHQRGLNLMKRDYLGYTFLIHINV